MHHQTAKEVYDQKISKKKDVSWPRLRSKLGNWLALTSLWSRPRAFCALPAELSLKAYEGSTAVIPILQTGNCQIKR